MITCFRQSPAVGPHDITCPKGEEFLKSLPDGAIHGWFASGRAALFNTLQHFDVAAGSGVLMPAYMAAGVIEPVQRLGLTVHFYHTADHLLFDEQNVIAALDSQKNIRVVIVLHPMGRLQSIKRLAGECRSRGIVLVEDCAQGLFTRYPTGEPIGSQGDVALFSLTKYIGTADGALAVIRHQPVRHSQGVAPRPFSRRLAGAWYRLHLAANRTLHESSNTVLCRLWMRLSEFFHERFYALAGEDYRAGGPSPATVEALQELNVCRIVRQRRQNVEYLYSALKSDVLRLVYPTDWPGWVPMAVPAFVIKGDRAAVQQKARHAGVFLASLSNRWNYIPQNAAGFEAEHYYLNHHVLIPINEHIDNSRMRQVVRVLNELHGGDL